MAAVYYLRKYIKFHDGEEPSHAHKLVSFSHTHRHASYDPLTCHEAHDVMVQHILNEDILDSNPKTVKTRPYSADDSKVESDGDDTIESLPKKRKSKMPAIPPLITMDTESDSKMDKMSSDDSKGNIARPSSDHDDSAEQSHHSCDDPPRRQHRSDLTASEHAKHPHFIQTRSPSGPRGKVRCICGRKMVSTKNPDRSKYPPRSVLKCNQKHCGKKLVIEGVESFYFCPKRTAYHGTKDGKYTLCSGCARDEDAQQQRHRKNEQLLRKQNRDKESGQVVPFRKRKDDGHCKALLVKEGFMMKRGSVWNTAYKKRYFRLWSDRKLYYFKAETDTSPRGVIDLNGLHGVNEREETKLEIITADKRIWQCLCDDEEQRDSWCAALENVCNAVRTR